MPLYAVIGFDHPPHSMALRDRWRTAHRAYELAHDQNTRLAGAFYGPGGQQCGTLKIVAAENADEVRRWYEHEPFYVGGVYRDFHIIELGLALNRIPDSGGWVALPPTINR